MSSTIAQTKKRKKTREEIRENIAGYMFLLPWLIGLIVFTAFPIGWSLWISLTNRTMALGRNIEFIGFGNYRRLLDDPIFRQSLRVTVLYAVWQIPLSRGLALLAALAMNRKMKGIGIFRTLFYLPVIIGGTVGANVMWRMLLRDRGYLNQILDFFNLGPIGFLTNPSVALYSLIGVSLWGIGGPMIIFLAGLQQVPEELYESATMDGAGSFRKLISVTLPMISPIILFSFIMGIIGALQVFEAGLVITGGGPARATNFLVLYLFRESFTYGRFGYASAIAWVLFLIIMAVTFCVLKFSENHVFSQANAAGGKDRS